MQLAWTDRDEIAKALIKAHPDADRLALDLDAVTALVVALPGFVGPAQPPRPAYVEAILWTWMRLADEAMMQQGGDGGGTSTRRGVFGAVAGGGG